MKSVGPPKIVMKSEFFRPRFTGIRCCCGFCSEPAGRRSKSALRGFLVGGPPSAERRRCDSRGGPAPLALRSRPWATRPAIRQIPHVPTRCAGRGAAGCKGGGAFAAPAENLLAAPPGILSALRAHNSFSESARAAGCTRYVCGRADLGIKLCPPRTLRALSSQTASVQKKCSPALLKGPACMQLLSARRGSARRRPPRCNDGPATPRVVRWG